MAKTAKLIVAQGPYEVYRAGHVLIINRDGEFHCNLRKTDRGFHNPAQWVADAIRCDEEAIEDRARALAARRADAAAYLALRAERAARQPQLNLI